MTGRGPASDAKNTITYETARLFVDLPTPTDAPVLFDLIGGEHRHEVCATLIWDGPDDITDTEAWITKVSNAAFGAFGFHWAIRDKTGQIAGRAGEPLGAIGTRPRGEPGRADVGYWLGRPYWGQGLMGEALRKLVEIGFTTLDFYKIEADVYTHNVRSARLVRSVGMTQEGIIRRAHRKYGEWVDAAVFGILREEWQALHD